jgi:uncharacterized protein (DUF1697 family)
MTRLVALLRGINVGRHNRVGMSQVRELMDGLGYDGVRTHLQSGNVVFTTGSPPERAAQEIADRLAHELGFMVRVLVRTRDELAQVVKRDPLAAVASDPARYLVTFLSAAPDRRRLSALDAADYEPDVFRLVGREIYSWYPNGVHATKLTNSFWEKQLGVTGTARNWNTVTRLLALADE